MFDFSFDNPGDVAMALLSIALAFFISSFFKSIFQSYVGSKGLRHLSIFLVGLLVAGAIFVAYENTFRGQVNRLTGPYMHSFSADRGDPIVLGIYPSDSFGIDQREGLHLALEPFLGQIRIEDLRAPLTEMKTNDADSLLSELRHLILNENVVAVIGPPVTEFSEAVIQTVEDTGRPVPVFITSAAPRDSIGWSNAKPPLFRVNSGVDERAEELVALTNAANQRGIQISFWVEDSEIGEGDDKREQPERLYGEAFFDEIKNKIPSYSERAQEGNISVHKFYHRDISTIIQRIPPDNNLTGPRLHLLLGLGGDLKSAMDSSYLRTQSRQTSFFGGWMSAYATNEPLASGEYQEDRLFEITDVSAAAESNPEDLVRFERRFGQLSPATRDQAFSFDAGMLVYRAFSKVLHESGRARDDLVVDSQFLLAIVAKLRDNRWSGVTGQITFDEIGQNRKANDGSRLLSFAMFKEDNWDYLLDEQALLDLIEEAYRERSIE